ncbi:uncharacterized protein [Oryza sativa Japonica Group]|uniref:uncharacterized protein isoform X2 n=1 Tax=Oryza sativa subsp. japonica TaxID=39947 RepID=UPI0007755185|nr:uncharacterized protein LOC4348481 isoform X4 [Oryza sativa Japonica Group]
MPLRVLPPLGIAMGDSWSDTEIIMFLAERKTWDPLPQNILVGVDLTMIDPRDSPGTLWFLNWPDNQLCYDDENNVFRKAKNGYWKCVDACRIQTGTSILGVKLCLEFHEGQTPCGTRSGLMMYEYLIEQNDELNLPQAYKSLCRMFLQKDRKIVEDEHISLNLGVHHNFLGSYSQYLAEIQRQNMVMNSQAVSSDKKSIFIRELDERKSKKCSTKITRSSTRLYRQKIPHIWCLRHSVSRKWFRESMFRVIDKLAKLLESVLLDLATVRQKINKGKKRIWKMEGKLEKAQIQHLTDFNNKYGPSIRQSVETAEHNNCALRCLNNYLELMIEEPRFSSIAYVRLDSQVKKLDKENTSAMDLSSSLHQMLQKLNLRVQDEEVWVSQLGSNLQASFRKIMDTSSEIGKLEDEVLQLKVDIAEFAPGEVTSCAVYEMIKTLQIVELFMNNSTRHLKLIDGINSEMREFGSIFNGKVRCLVRFARYQQTIMEKSTQIINFLGDIRAKVDKMTQMYGLSEVVPIVSNQFIEGSFNADAYAFESLKEHSTDLCFSWRTRKFHNRLILPPVRQQTSGTCSYYATLSSVESLYKREYASYPTILKDKIGQPDEFLVNLSRAQLEDIVEDFYTRHKVKGSKRLNVCLDKMKNEGVISEESYMNPQAQFVQSTERYKIKQYEELNLEIAMRERDKEEVSIVDKKCIGKKKKRRFRKKMRMKEHIFLTKIKKVIESHIMDGKVLIASFRVTTGYFRLLPHQIYKIPEEDPQYELNKKGNPCSHCVVVVGFGIRDGECYLIYLNSYGTSWGHDGFGRIYLDSVRKLFLAQV